MKVDPEQLASLKNEQEKRRDQRDSRTDLEACSPQEHRWMKCGCPCLGIVTKSEKIWSHWINTHKLKKGQSS